MGALVSQRRERVRRRPGVASEGAERSRTDRARDASRAGRVVQSCECCTARTGSRSRASPHKLLRSRAASVRGSPPRLPFTAASIGGRAASCQSDTSLHQDMRGVAKSAAHEWRSRRREEEGREARGPGYRARGWGRKSKGRSGASGQQMITARHGRVSERARQEKGATRRTRGRTWPRIWWTNDT